MDDNCKIQALVSLHDPYTHSRVLNALATRLPQIAVQDLRSHPTKEYDMETEVAQRVKSTSGPIVCFLEYEAVPFELLVAQPERLLANCYCIRKGLIRKAQLAICLERYRVKRPESTLTTHVPPTWVIQLDRAEDLDELLVDECWEVGKALEENTSLEPAKRTRFLLKPSMTAGGYGIHVFDTEERLRNIMKELHPEVDDEDENEEEVEGMEEGQMKEYVLQRYIQDPLLPPKDKRKFHVRAYVLSIGGIQVYVHREMLALFAHSPYFTDSPTEDLSVHLTNTCAQEGMKEFKEALAVRSYWELDELGVPLELLESSWSQIQQVVGDVFAAAASEPAWFQLLPNAFEIFGVDLMLDSAGDVYFLEANAFPDFGQTGKRLGDMVGRVFEEVCILAIDPWIQRLAIQDPDEAVAGLAGKASVTNPDQVMGFSLVYSSRMRA